MLQVIQFTFNPFGENTYLIVNEKKECWIVDPGMSNTAEVQHFFDNIAKNGLIPQAIINTHAHIDHIIGIPAVIEKYKVPFYLHRADEGILKRGKDSAEMFGFSFPNTPTVSGYIDEQKPLMLGNDVIEVRFTPGHSPGSVCFYFKPGNWVIGGDVLFAGSIGRTDLWQGNHETLLNSIRTQLFTLPSETVVFPGHGPATSVGEEKATNPFFR